MTNRHRAKKRRSDIHWTGGEDETGSCSREADSDLIHNRDVRSCVRRVRAHDSVRSVVDNHDTSPGRLLDNENGSEYFELKRETAASYVVPGGPKRGRRHWERRAGFPRCEARLPAVKIRALDREWPRGRQERGGNPGI